jgi:hypothetical protein
MPRTQPGAADLTLIAYARYHGEDVSASQLERWRGQNLLPANIRAWPGRGSGSSSIPAPGAEELVVFLAREAARGRRPADLALLAFAAGHAVPELGVKAALRRTIQRVKLRAKREISPDGGDRDDWAWAVADRELQRSAASVLVPRRMRDIDERLATAGINWGDAGLAQLDKGTSDDAMTPKDASAFTLVAMLLGGEEMTDVGIAQLLRSVTPHGASSPIASMMEFPEGDSRQAADVHDGAGRFLIPRGDVRDDLLRVVDAASMDDLRLAWDAAVEQRRWALALVAAVEAELDSGPLGPASFEWLFSGFLGMPRMMLREELRTRRDSPSSRAATAVGMLWMCDGLRALRQMVPDGQFHLLDKLLPGFLHPLAGVGAPPAISLHDRFLAAEEDLS